MQDIVLGWLLQNIKIKRVGDYCALRSREIRSEFVKGEVGEGLGESTMGASKMHYIR